jgi:hypothetical protein
VPGNLKSNLRVILAGILAVGEPLFKGSDKTNEACALRYDGFYDTMARKRVSQAPADRLFATFQNNVRGARWPARVISEARRDMPVELFSAAIAWLRNTPYRGAPSSTIEFPQGFKQIRRVPDPEPTTLVREFLWAAKTLEQRADPIRDFVSLAREYSRTMMSSDYLSAFSVLDTLDQHLGKSLWGMANRIALSGLSKDTATHKALVAEIKAEASPGEVEYLAHYFGVRNEQAITWPSFKRLYLRHESAQDLPRAYSSYFRFHLLPRDPPSFKQLPTILAFESTSPIIDYYQTVLRICGLLLKHHPHHFGPAAAPAIRMLAESIDDVRLSAFSCFGELDATKYLSTAKPLSPDAFDYFLQGQYQTAGAAVTLRRVEDPDCYELIQLAARIQVASGVLPPNPLPAQIGAELVSRLASVLAKDADAVKNWLALLKLSVNFSSLAWADALDAFCSQEHGEKPVNEAAQIVWSESTPPTTLFAPNSFAVPQAVRLKYLERCAELFPAHFTLRYFLILNRIVQVETGAFWESLDPGHKALLLAEVARSNSDYEGTLAAAKTLTNDDRPYFKHKAIRMCSHALLDIGRVEECIDYITSVYLANPELGSILPVSQAIENVDSAVRDRLKGDLSLAILYDMYVQHFADDLDGALQFAFEDALEAHDCSRPSELRDCVDRFDRAKLIYFLRNICVPQVMDGSVEFNSSAELEDERMAVCQLLAELDAARKAAYQAESTEIARRKLIKRRMQEIELSKIYVDIERIKKLAQEDFSETFARYKALPVTDVSSIERVVEAIKKVAAEPKTIVILTLPQNEKTSVLKNLFSDLRDLFVSSSEYGLDGYLSVRIRHGTLAGQLRSSLEGAHLLTQRERDSTDYRPNTYWPAQLYLTDQKQNHDLAQRLARFSGDFDSLIQEVTNEWIQVRTTEEGKGVFDFRLNDPQIAVLRASLVDETTLEVFLDFAFAMLWQKLDSNLTLMRERLASEAKSRFDVLLVNLQRNLEHVAKGVDISDLNNALTSVRTDLANAVNRVIQWFQLPRQTSNTPFPIADAITIAVESIRRFHREVTFDPDVMVTGDITLPGLILPGVVDVFIIMFENIIRHSRTASPPTVAVNVSIKAQWITFVVENEIGQGVYSEASVEQISRLKSEVERGGYKKSVAAEGGTGFHKIWKIIAHDVGGGATLNFGFRSSTKFFVEISMERWPNGNSIS